MRDFNINLELDVPHREAADIMLQVRHISMAFADLQSAWAEFRKISEWTARDGRIYDYVGNFVAARDDAPTIYRMIHREEDDQLRKRDGYDIPYEVIL